MQNMWNVTWLSFIDLGIDSKCSSSGLMNSQWTRQQSCTVDWLSSELVNQNCTNQSSYLTKVLALDGSIWKLPAGVIAWTQPQQNEVYDSMTVTRSGKEASLQRALPVNAGARTRAKLFMAKQKSACSTRSDDIACKESQNPNIYRLKKYDRCWCVKAQGPRAYKANGCQDSQKLEPYTTGHLDLTKNCDCGRLTCKMTL